MASQRPLRFSYVVVGKARAYARREKDFPFSLPARGESAVACILRGPLGGRLRMRDSGLRRRNDISCRHRRRSEAIKVRRLGSGLLRRGAPRNDGKRQTRAETAEEKIESAGPVLQAIDAGRAGGAAGSRVHGDQAPLRGIAAAVARVRARLLPAAQTMRGRGRFVPSSRLAADAAGTATARLRRGHARRPAATTAGDAQRMAVAALSAIEFRSLRRRHAGAE